MLKLLLAAIAAILLAACAGPGDVVRIPVTMPGGEKATIVAHNQQAPDWLLDRDHLAMNYIVKGEVSDKQLTAVAEAERACRIYTKTARPHNLVAVLSNGALYFAAGYAGMGWASHAFRGVDSNQYALYGGRATGTAGIANGIITLGGQTYTFENCGREIMDLFPVYTVRVLNKSPY